MRLAPEGNIIIYPLFFILVISFGIDFIFSSFPTISKASWSYSKNDVLIEVFILFRFIDLYLAFYDKE